MVTTANAVTSTISKTVKLHKYNTTTEQNSPEADYCCGKGNGIPKNGYHHSNKYYLSALVQVLLDRSHNGHLVFFTKDKPMMLPYAKGLVPQSWNTSNGISQRH
jgi:hypothetical protein